MYENRKWQELKNDGNKYMKAGSKKIKKRINKANEWKSISRKHKQDPEMKRYLMNQRIKIMEKTAK